MRKLAIGAALAAFAVAAVPAQAAQFIYTFPASPPGSPLTIPNNNDFKADLNGLGLFSYATNGSLVLDAPGRVTFEFLGSESGFRDTFSATGIPSYTENSTIENHFALPIVLGSAVYGAGALPVQFTNSGNPVISGVNSINFGVFLPRGGTSPYATNVIYFGYDDQINNKDDNHDDFIVRATVNAVPEPATWLMMILGFGMVGFAARRRTMPTVTA